MSPSSIITTTLASLLVTFTTHAEEQKPSIEKNKIHTKIRENMKDIRYCQKASDPKASGKLVLEWEILSNGKVGVVKVLKSVESSLDECIIQKLKTWTFQKPSNDTTIRIKYPIVFSNFKD